MRIILADDHELVRAGIRPFLDELADNVEVVEAESYDRAMEEAVEGPVPTLVILDLRMPGMQEGGLANFRRRFPETPVVILSASVEIEDVVMALQEGAAGYIPKTFGGPATQNALRLVLSGERFFPSFALEAAVEGGGVPKRGGNGSSEPPGSVLDKLSVRERDILTLMIAGGTNKEIARQLSVQEITVKVHLRNIYRKLGAANRAQAVRIALENGWQTPGTQAAAH
ncbi:response regulator transcription factor [Novispirillum sp. DQ9]|uniref:response regulator transcription factor n=1 Tax=Novispirillum sp. DQ9 TaxID=3398612 RepID=UPI003C7A2DA7